MKLVEYRSPGRRRVNAPVSFVPQTVINRRARRRMATTFVPKAVDRHAGESLRAFRRAVEVDIAAQFAVWHDARRRATWGENAWRP